LFDAFNDSYANSRRNILPNKSDEPSA